LAALGIRKGATPALQSRVGRLSALLPSIELAREELCSQGPRLDEETVHRMARQLGAEVLTIRTRDLQRFRDGLLPAGQLLTGRGPAARTRSRVIRPYLRFGVSPVFIPEGGPQFHGSVEDFNGWSQGPLLRRRSRWPGGLRRGRAQPPEAVNTRHAHPRLGGRSPAQHRRGRRLQELPWCQRVGCRRPRGA
jgi:hypothetical protein